MALREVRDVTLHFGGIVALDGVPFAELSPGRMRGDVSVLIKGGRIIAAADERDPPTLHVDVAEGTEVTGSPEVVLLRGNVLVENGDLVADPGIGQFVERAAFGQELLPAAAR